MRARTLGLTAPPCLLLELPDELLAPVVTHLGAAALLSIAATAKAFLHAGRSAQDRLLSQWPPLPFVVESDLPASKVNWLHVLACSDSIMAGTGTSRGLLSTLRHVGRHGVAQRPDHFRRVFRTHAELCTALALLRTQPLDDAKSPHVEWSAAFRRLADDSCYRSTPFVLAHVGLLQHTAGIRQEDALRHLWLWLGTPTADACKARAAIVVAVGGCRWLLRCMQCFGESTPTIARICAIMSFMEAPAKLFEAGAIPLLAQQMRRQDDTRIVYLAVVTLKNLTCVSPEAKVAIGVSRGAVASLVAQISQPCELDIAKVAAGALMNLTHLNLENREIVAAAGAIPALMGLAQSADPREQEEATGALGNLTVDHPRNLAVITAAGGITLLDRLAHSKDSGVRARAVHALANLRVGHWGRSRTAQRHLSERVERAKKNANMNANNNKYAN